jgi:hypothetical protein
VFLKTEFQRKNEKVNEKWNTGFIIRILLFEKKEVFCPFYKRAQAAVFGLSMNIRQIQIRPMHSSIDKI